MITAGSPARSCKHDTRHGSKWAEWHNLVHCHTARPCISLATLVVIALCKGLLPAIKGEKECEEEFAVQGQGYWGEDRVERSLGVDTMLISERRIRING
jgi:hypothetical protein